MWFSSKTSLSVPEAETEYGKISGKLFILPDGKITNVFLGIPFAKPPINELRFEKPQPPEPWDGILQTKKYKCRSIQKDFIWDLLELKVLNSEDCLYLNIMTPEKVENKKYPVMIYIHGGGFVMDSAVKYHYSKICRNIVSKDVIFVTIQYRLGYLGFLTTNDETALGNYGMWDQLMAIKFIKNNIANFNGDPENITLLGQSAGGVAVDLLSISPHSRDLFSKIILMAGNAETMWSISPRCKVAKNCQRKAIQLGFIKPTAGLKWTKEDNEAMLKFLKNVPANTLGLTMVGSTNIFDSIQLPLTPVIDGDFLPKCLTELRKESPKKLIIAGNCEFEGLLFLALGLKSIDRHLFEGVKHRASMIILEGNKLIDENLQTSIKIFEKIYSLNDQNMARKEMEKTVVRVSATHGSEINTLFDINIFVSPHFRTINDRKVTDIISTLFTNFAKCGNPNEFPSPILFDFDWEPIKSEISQKCLSINVEPKMEEIVDNSKCMNAAFSAIQTWMTKATEEEYMEFMQRTKSTQPAKIKWLFIVWQTIQKAYNVIVYCTQSFSSYNKNKKHV
uniref:Carboxylesterase type B domain-containing protein n=1 Tax=Panagrolaimus sp. PS1159 TaxID=55785 RepID=A0AC35FZV2_9BILA